MISRGYAVRHILFVEISRKTGYDLIRGRDVVKCHDLFLWRNADGPALDTLDETLPYDAHWNMKECGIPKSWDLERN